MKKISLYLLVFGIILVLIPILFPNIFNKHHNNDSSNSNTIEEKKESEWTILYGSDLEKQYFVYNQSELMEEYFYSIDGTNNKYVFLVPKSDYLSRVAYYENYYAGDVIVEYGDNKITDINDYANKYVEQYGNNYDKLYIQKKVVNNKIAIYLKAYKLENNSYFEELKILFKNDKDNYSFVRYQLHDAMFSNELINELIDKFQQNKEKIESNCTKVNNDYQCEMNINSINKKITFNVDASKYNLKSNVSYNNYEEKFENIINENDEENKLDEQIYMSLITSNNVVNSLNNNDRLNLSNAKNIKINNVDVKKYDLTDNTIYRANYVILLSDNVAMFIDIESTKNTIDDVIKDFVNFTIS